MKISDMYRDDMLSFLYDMANELADNFTWPNYRNVARLACDWNSSHVNETEIFVDGWKKRGCVYLAIEDDYWKYEV